MVANVATGAPITEAWGDSVADAINLPDIGTGDVRLRRTNTAQMTLSATGAPPQFLVAATTGFDTYIDALFASGQTAYLRIYATGDAAERISLSAGVGVPSVRMGGGASIDLRLYRSAASALTIDNGGGGTATLGITGFIDTNATYRVSGVNVVGARKTGWATASGTATRTTFATSTVTLVQLAERVKALIDDLASTGGHGLIGP